MEAIHLDSRRCLCEIQNKIKEIVYLTLYMSSTRVRHFNTIKHNISIRIIGCNVIQDVFCSHIKFKDLRITQVKVKTAVIQLCAQLNRHQLEYSSDA